MDVDAYLHRIGTPPRVLSDLHRAHQETVPFENLSIHLGEPVSLAAGDLFTKIVRRRRGGFCYELNGLFALLLENLGWAVERLSARVFGADRLGPPFDHMLLRVTGPDPGESWLADVGFGSHSTYPLLFGSRAEQDDPGGCFQLVDAPDGDLDLLKDGRPQYRIEQRPRALDDFTATCWYQQTWPGSHFRAGPVCSRLDGDGRVSLAGRTLIVTRGSGRTERELGSDAEVLAAYREHFGLALDRVPG